MQADGGGELSNRVLKKAFIKEHCIDIHPARQPSSNGYGIAEIAQELLSGGMDTWRGMAVFQSPKTFGFHQTLGSEIWGFSAGKLQLHTPSHPYPH